jgi:hypothetical protein
VIPGGLHPPSGTAALVSPSIPSRTGRKHIVGNIPWDVVARHDLLHFAFVLGKVITIALAPILQPVFVRFVKLLLIFGRKPSLKLADIVMRRISVRSCDGVERRVRRDVLTPHDFFHLARVLVYVMAVILGIGFLPFVVFVVEFLLIAG